MVKDRELELDSYNTLLSWQANANANEMERMLRRILRPADIAKLDRKMAKKGGKRKRLINMIMEEKKRLDPDKYEDVVVVDSDDDNKTSTGVQNEQVHDEGGEEVEVSGARIEDNEMGEEDEEEPEPSKTDTDTVPDKSTAKVGKVGGTRKKSASKSSATTASFDWAPSETTERTKSQLEARNARYRLVRRKLHQLKDMAKCKLLEQQETGKPLNSSVGPSFIEEGFSESEPEDDYTADELEQGFVLDDAGNPFFDIEAQRVAADILLARALIRKRNPWMASNKRVPENDEGRTYREGFKKLENAVAVALIHEEGADLRPMALVSKYFGLIPTSKMR